MKRKIYTLFNSYSPGFIQTFPRTSRKGVGMFESILYCLFLMGSEGTHNLLNKPLWFLWYWGPVLKDK